MPLPTGAGNGGARREASLGDETTAVLHAIPRKAAARTGVEAIVAEAKVRARAARIRSVIGAETTGSGIETTLLVDELLFSRPAHGPERV